MAKFMPSATYLPSGEVVLILPQDSNPPLKIADIRFLVIVLRGPEVVDNAS